VRLEKNLLENKLKYYLEIADNALVLAKRLRELKNSSSVPFETITNEEYLQQLENFAKDVYVQASHTEAESCLEVSIWIQKRDIHEFYNCLLVEIECSNYIEIIVRQLFFDTFHYLYLLEMTRSKDVFLAQLSGKHLAFFNRRMFTIQNSILRKKDCPAELKLKLQETILSLWKYVPDLFQASTVDILMMSQEKGVNLTKLRLDWEGNLSTLLRQINLSIPTSETLKILGKEGQHTENLSKLLAKD